MAEIWEESEEERGRRLARKRKQRERVQMQPPPREVQIGECEREELQLAKQRKRMAVFRNANHSRRSARLQAEQLCLQQLTLLALALFTLLTLPCTRLTVNVPRLLIMSRTCRFKG